MTTQELKQNIEKVLGNNIRCLLPSYWWKRLFNQVADRVDEVEQSTSQLIDSKVEEVNMPIVESVDELDNLKLAKGRVAVVEKTGESATVKISDCYLSTNSEEDWGKYTIVKGVEEKDNVIIDKDTSVFFTASKGMVTKDAIQVNTISSGIFYYMKWTDDEAYVTSLEGVNKALSSGKYRAVQCLNAPDDYFTFYSEKPQPSLYIKGDSWERLAKESDLEGIEGGNEDDVNEKIEDAVGAVVFYVDTNGGQLDEEYIAANAEQYKRLRKSDGMLANRPVYVKNYDGFLTAQMVVIDAYKKVGLIFETYEGRRLSVTIFPNGTYSDIADASSSSGAEIRELYIGDSLTEGQKAWNLETKQLVEQNKCITVHVLTEPIDILPAGTMIPQSLYKDSLFYYMATAGNNQIIVNIGIDSNGNGLIAKEVGVPDSKLSDISENVVQNKAIKAYVDEKVANSGGGSSVDVDTELSNTSTNPVQNKVITNAINAKADNTRVDLISERLDDLESEMVTDADLDRAIASAITNTLNTEV